MKTIKLSTWCDKTGVKYLTAWRWFKNKKMPVYAYQTESGTILVEDDEDNEIMENKMDALESNNNVMTMFLKKTVEFSKNNSSIEDFAAYVLSNFNLKVNSNATDESLKYSKNKPSKEEINNHFKGFMVKSEKPVASMFLVNADKLSSLTDEIKRNDETTANNLGTVIPYESFCNTVSSPDAVNENTFFIKNANLSNNISDTRIGSESLINDVISASTTVLPAGATGDFVLTQKELEQSNNTITNKPTKKKK